MRIYASILYFVMPDKKKCDVILPEVYSLDVSFPEAFVHIVHINISDICSVQHK